MRGGSLNSLQKHLVPWMVFLAVGMLAVVGCSTQKPLPPALPPPELPSPAAEIETAPETIPEPEELPAPVVPEAVPLVSPPAEDAPPPFPREYAFTARSPAAPKLPPGIGLPTADRNDPVAALSTAQRTALTAAFRDAFTLALLHDDPPAGVLGGDKIHRWPGKDVPSLVQNWRTLREAPNSWGLPNLVLAIQRNAAGRVHLVRGRILDQFGKGGGVGGANGISGYGAPLGNEFPHPEGIAQRFDLGLIVADREGATRFMLEEPPSRIFPPPDGVGRLPEGGVEAAAATTAAAAAATTATAAAATTTAAVATAVSAAVTVEVLEEFRRLWQIAVDSDYAPEAPDGPVRMLDASPWTAPASGSGAESGIPPLKPQYIFVQSYGSASWAMVYAPLSGLPRQARLMGQPFLEILLSAPTRLLPNVPGEPPGALAGKRTASADEGWITGFLAYGFPLGDMYTIQNGRAQLFSKGLIEAAAQASASEKTEEGR